MKINERWLADHGLTQEDVDAGRAPGPIIVGGQFANEPGGGGANDNDDSPGDPSDGGGSDGGPDDPIPPGSEDTFSREDVDRLIKEAIAGLRDELGPNTGLNPFRKRLGEVNPLFFEAGNQLFQRTQGFDPFLDRREKRQLSATTGDLQELFSRRGGGGTGSEIDAIIRARQGIRSDFDERQFARQDVARREFGDFFKTGLENLTIEEQLNIARLNAENAGKT